MNAFRALWRAAYYELARAFHYAWPWGFTPWAVTDRMGSDK